MKKLKLSVALIYMLLLSFSVVGQNILELDLTIPPGKERVVSQNENKTFISIKLINRVPSKKYKVWFETELEMINALDASSYLSSTESPTCETLLSMMSEIKEDPNLRESEVEEKIKEMSDVIKQCQDEDIKKDFFALFEEVIEMDIQVKTGEVVKVYVSRDDQVWTFILKGRQPGKWVTTYGFGFTSQKQDNATYYTKQIPDTSVHQILRARDADILDLNYVPAIFFSYFPSQRFNSCWNHSLTAGLGVDLSAPVVFFGYNGLFYNNIGFSTGIAFQQQNRLKSIYSENEIIAISLDKDQLHDRVYRPNFFISIHFRFGESPFKSNKESDNE